MASHPSPSTPAWPSVNPRPLKALHPPPQLSPHALPSLPSPPRLCSFSSLYTLTTHIIPAAYIRTTPDVPVPAFSDEIESKEARRTRVKQTTEDILSLKDRYAGGMIPGSSVRPLWICVNRYVRKGLSERRSGKSLTLFFAHAIGFPKEIWEPTIHHMLALNQTSSVGPDIDEIWSFEAVQNGDSGLLNADNLTGLYDWADNSRDILNFLLNYLPSTASPSPLPTHLQRLPEHVSESRKTHGFSDRTLAAVGHSFGGCTSVLAAHTYPALFSSLVLVDPVILPVDSYHARILRMMVSGALQRRERWSSREEAWHLLSSSPFFSTWDPGVLKIYVECGLTPDPDGGVKLKTSPIQEAILFADKRVSYETFELMETLDPRVELRWVMPGRPAELGRQEIPYRVWRRPTNASNMTIPHAGHLIVQEAPQQLAQDLHGFLRRKFRNTRAKL